MHSMSALARKGKKHHPRKLLALTLLAFAGAGMAVGAAGPAAAGSGAAAGSAPVTQATKPVPTQPPIASNVHLGSGLSRKTSRSTHGVRLNNPTNGWSVSLTTNNTSPWPTQSSTLTATASQDVGPTPYYIVIHDIDSGAVVASCAFGATCSAPVGRATPGVVGYWASISDSAGNVVASSIPNVVDIDWLAVHVSLAANPTTVALGGTATVSATADENVGPSPFYIDIYDTNTNTLIASCGFGTTCKATVSQSVAGAHVYVGYVGLASASAPPTELQTTSTPVYVVWTDSGFQVSLSGPPSSPGPETVIATTNMDIGPTPYYTEIIDQTTGAMLALCGAGTSCSASVTPNGDDLVAFVTQVGGPPPPSGAVAASNIIEPFFSGQTIQ